LPYKFALLIRNLYGTRLCRSRLKHVPKSAGDRGSPPQMNAAGSGRGLRSHQHANLTVTTQPGRAAIITGTAQMGERRPKVRDRKNETPAVFAELTDLSIRTTLPPPDGESAQKRPLGRDQDARNRATCARWAGPYTHGADVTPSSFSAAAFNRSACSRASRATLVGEPKIGLLLNTRSIHFM
jgi:hypothetical protein